MMSQEFALKNKNPPCGYYCIGCKYYFAEPKYHANGNCSNSKSEYYQEIVHADFCCIQKKPKKEEEYKENGRKRPGKRCNRNN